MDDIIKAVIFDQDGLMFNTEWLAAEAWNQIGRGYGINVDNDFLRDLRGMKPDKIKDVFQSRFGTDIDYDSFREEKRRFSYDWIEKNGVPVKKGLKELLQYLKDHGVKTAVATASSIEWTRRNVEGAGIGKYFDEYVYGDMVEEAKPNPAIFLLAAEKLGVKPSQCVVLEDSFNGIKAASAGGFLPVMVPDQDQPDDGLLKLLTARCGSLLEVINLFEEGKLELDSQGKGV